MVRCTQRLIGGIIAEQALITRLRTSLGYAIGGSLNMLTTNRMLFEQSRTSLVVLPRAGWVDHVSRTATCHPTRDAPTQTAQALAMTYVACLSKVFVGLAHMNAGNIAISNELVTESRPRFLAGTWQSGANSMALYHTKNDPLHESGRKLARSLTPGKLVQVHEIEICHLRSCF